MIMEGTAPSYGTVGCTSTSTCVGDADLSSDSNWACVDNPPKCGYSSTGANHVPLTNWVGTCSASICKGSVLASSLTCERQQTCRMAASLGGDELTNTKCSSSFDCANIGTVTDEMFKCDSSTVQQNQEQAGGGGQCMFGIDETNFARLPNFPVNWCTEDDDCYQAWVRAGLTCGGPSFEIAVRGHLSCTSFLSLLTNHLFPISEISELKYGNTTRDVVPYGTIRYYHLPVCNPQSPIDIHLKVH